MGYKKKIVGKEDVPRRGNLEEALMGGRILLEKL